MSVIFDNIGIDPGIIIIFIAFDRDYSHWLYDQLQYEIETSGAKV